MKQPIVAYFISYSNSSIEVVVSPHRHPRVLVSGVLLGIHD